MQILFLFIFLILSLAACATGSSDGQTEASGKLRVVTTIGQIADTVRNVGGEHVAVTSLMGPGVDPHLYVASESDVGRLDEADIIFYNGLFLEAQMANILEQLGERQTTVAVAGNLDEGLLIPSPIYAGEHDPHVWFDVTLWMKAVEAVRDTLVEVDPEHAGAYQANAEAYLAQLAELHQYVTEQANRVPEQQRVLITAHDAFNYFGRAYGFDVRGLQGISTAAEASTADVQALADFIAENEIRAIFIESSVPVRTIEAVQAAVAAKGFNVEIGGQLFSDAMGDPDTPEGTYIGMVRYNIDIIVGALLGEG
jgi:manganese/zinc/iron transport system substrate-binding protein